MDAIPATRRILLTGVTSSTRLLVRHVLQSLGYLVDEAAEAVGGAPGRYALVVAGPRALDVDGRLSAQAGPDTAVPVILIGAGEAAPGEPVIGGGAGSVDLRACLAEPLELARFLAIVRGVLESGAALARGSVPEQRPAEDPVDLERLHDFAGDDQDLVEELCSLYFTTARSYLAEMAEALRPGGDTTRSAHALKGASANFGAREVAGLALAAETQGVTQERLEQLRRALGRAEAFMARQLPPARMPA
ncbi:Hpt domain-containing protein [Geminicoccus roseus]|uniref:Hpt domain-containing protein n=1 Tax=Geminicoccus roseus TaxID=404900 RepID=UPI000557F667|nr:Hpt domain-containing protein [Geminicoccus roseus]